MTSSDSIQKGEKDEMSLISRDAMLYEGTVSLEEFEKSAFTNQIRHDGKVRNLRSTVQ